MNCLSMYGHVDVYRLRLEKVEKKAAAGDASPKAGAGEGLSDFMSSFSAVRTSVYLRTIASCTVKFRCFLENVALSGSIRYIDHFLKWRCKINCFVSAGTVENSKCA
eukprot:COSAG02_NODE_1785_length_10940_cov_9.153399_6_plen_107_part_00